MVGNNFYPNEFNYASPSFRTPIAPPAVDPDEGELISVAYNPAWQPALEGALMQLMQPSTWIGDHDAKILAINRAETLRLILTEDIPREGVPTPFWDEAQDLDDEVTPAEQLWYGEVADENAAPDEITFTENVGIWIITGFVAYAATPAAAIFFHTIAPRFVHAFHKGDVREIWRVVVDSADYGVIDTADYAADAIIELPIIADPAVTTGHDIFIINMAIP